ncbi:amino acid ABC transporter substrate-binding protein [Variovorax sp. HJSM1_2]|uniref:amino acid ABC transporter substrate-binding protein n=1 Tax=Variovorax sp. HJSM1_2 TaxID=3366263 RepID=UPI003BE3C186
MQSILCKLGTLTALTGAMLSALPAQADLLDKIRSSGSITLAYRDASIPFSYLDAQQKPIGYSMDLCLKVVDALRRDLKLDKLEVNYLLVTPGTRMEAMTSSKAQLECGSTTNNAERRKTVDFTIAHFISSVRLLVRSNAQVQSIDQLAGKSVVTTKGTTAVSLVRRASDERGLKLTLLEAPDHAQAFQTVVDGKAAAFAMDDVLLSGLRANAANPADYTLAGKPMSMEPYAIMLPPNEPAFKKLVDQEMRRVILSGEITGLYTKWFQQPIAPKGINLALPMPYLLKDSFKFPSDKVDAF